MELIIIKIILFIFILLALAFFCGAETALIGMSQIFVSNLKQTANSRFMKYIVFWESHSEEIIASIIIGMNLAIAGLSIVTASIVADI